MSWRLQTQVLVDDATASTTAPTGTTIGAQALAIPENIRDLALKFLLSGVTTPDVDVDVHVLDHDGSWRLESSFSLEDLEDESGDLYLPIASDAWLYKAVQPVFTLNSGAATMRCVATYRQES